MSHVSHVSHVNAKKEEGKMIMQTSADVYSHCSRSKSTAVACRDESNIARFMMVEWWSLTVELPLGKRVGDTKKVLDCQPSLAIEGTVILMTHLKRRRK